MKEFSKLTFISQETKDDDIKFGKQKEKKKNEKDDNKKLMREIDSYNYPISTWFPLLLKSKHSITNGLSCKANEKQKV